MQNARDLGELVLASDERRRRRGEIAAAPAVDGDGGDRGVVREDRLLKPPKLRPRLEPQLVGEHAPRLLERLERVGLAAAAVERQHQLPPQPLAEGVVRERRTERRRQLAMLAEREPDLEVLLERVDVQRLEPTCLGAEPRRARQALQRRPAPEGQRRRDRVRRGMGVAVAQRGARLREQLLEPHRVDARVLERVPVGRADDRLPLRARRGGGRCDDGARSAVRPGAPRPTGRRRARRRRPRGPSGAQASPAALDASSRPRPRASRPREPRTGREAGSQGVRSSTASGGLHG